MSRWGLLLVVVLLALAAAISQPAPRPLREQAFPQGLVSLDGNFLPGPRLVLTESTLTCNGYLIESVTPVTESAPSPEDVLVKRIGESLPANLSLDQRRQRFADGLRQDTALVQSVTVANGELIVEYRRWPGVPIHVGVSDCIQPQSKFLSPLEGRFNEFAKCLGIGGFVVCSQDPALKPILVAPTARQFAQETLGRLKAREPVAVEALKEFGLADLLRYTDVIRQPKQIRQEVR